MNYIVGDIHGMYDLLFEELNKINFDFKNDILYSVGDLVDRGPDSFKCLKLIEQSWFKPIVGNHEEFINIYFETLDTSQINHTTYLHIRNGGQWFHILTFEEQMYCKTLIDSLPYYYNLVINNKKVGIIHADCLDDFDEFKLNLNSNIDKTKELATWSRKRFNSNTETNIENIDYVFFGHTIVEDVTKRGNCYYIDTGAFTTNKLTILNLDKIII